MAGPGLKQLRPKRLIFRRRQHFVRTMPNGNLDVQIAFIAVKIFKPFDIFLVFIRQQTTIIHDPGNRVVPSAALPDFNVFAKLLVSEAQFRVIR